MCVKLACMPESTEQAAVCACPHLNKKKVLHATLHLSFCFKRQDLSCSLGTETAIPIGPWT